MLFATLNPRFVEDSRIVTAGPAWPGRAACHARNAVTEPSVEPLSTTTTRRGPGVAATSDSRHASVSVRPFQLTTTTPTPVLMRPHQAARGTAQEHLSKRAAGRQGLPLRASCPAPTARAAALRRDTRPSCKG